MPYTLMKGLAWILLALVLGIVIGWLLRTVTARRQILRARAHNVDQAELERLRGRIANLEPIVAERDRLSAELHEAHAVSDVVAVSGIGDADTTVPVAAELEQAPPATPDVAEASAVLGRAVALDDLKLVDGIGPNVEELCRGIGILTWWDLATTEVSLLRTMLADAGARFRNEDPATWPAQARLLAEGRWDEFKALSDELAQARSGK